MFIEGFPYVRRYGSGCLPFEGVGEKMFFEEGAAAGLEFEVCSFEVR